MLSGKHYIAGEWLDGPDVFQADNPSTGEKLPTQFQHGTEEIVDQAVQAASPSDAPAVRRARRLGSASREQGHAAPCRILTTPESLSGPGLPAPRTRRSRQAPPP